jgi:hypothetical protein
MSVLRDMLYQPLDKQSLVADTVLQVAGTL